MHSQALEINAEIQNNEFKILKWNFIKILLFKDNYDVLQLSLILIYINTKLKNLDAHIFIIINKNNTLFILKFQSKLVLGYFVNKK